MRLSKPAQAQLSMSAGAGAVVAGTFGLVGWQWAAIVAGGYAIGYGLLFVDVDGEGQQPGGPARRRRPIERGRR